MRRFCCCLFFLVLLAWAVPAAGARPLGDFNQALQDLVTRVRPAVVQIFTTGYVPMQGGFLSTSGQLRTEYAGGSGVLLSADGYILTNAHVVEGASRVQVLLSVPPGGTDPERSVLRPRGRMLGAQVLQTDPETDLAVLKVAGQNLPHLKLGDSEKLQQGQIVLAFGSPLGLENSVSMGVVSAKARQLRPEDPMIYIQTDATINPGNSGGPLVDTDGQVVGINTFILSQSGGSQGLGFAAPSNIARAVFEQIRTTGRMRRGVIGVRAQTITPVLAQGLGLPPGGRVILADVIPDGPAERAGLRPGDVVLSLNGKPMENGRQFTVNLYQRAIGKPVALQVRRGEERLEFSVEVAERPDDPLRFAELVDTERNLVPKLGILCLEIDRRVARLLPRPRHPASLVVAARAPEAPFWEGGFEPGDLILALNGTPVHTLEILRQRVAAFKSGDAVVVQVERDGVLRYIAFSL